MPNVQAHHLSKEKLEQLSKDPNNIVMDYKKREPLPRNQIVPMSEVKSHVYNLRLEYNKIRTTLPTPTIDYQTNDLIRKKLRQNQRWKRFDYTHPTIFDMVTNPKTTEKDINNLYTFIQLKAKHAVTKKDAVNFIKTHYDTKNANKKA